MSTVCVLTPLVISSWPAISAAVAGAAASLGFSVSAESMVQDPATPKRKVETEIENSEVIADGMSPGRTIVIRRGDVEISIGVDERGACTLCVTGERHSHQELSRLGEEVAGRVVQQFAYHKLVTELKSRNYSVVSEEVLSDQSVRLHVSLE